MNWLAIVIGALFAIGLVVGICRGAIKIAVSLLATVVTFVLVFFLTPYVSKGITSVTPLQEVVEHKVETTMVDVLTGGTSEGISGEGQETLIRNALDAAGISEEQLEALGITVEDIASGKVSKDDLAKAGISRNLLDGLENQTAKEQVLEEVQIPRDTQIAVLENADIPEVFRELLMTNNNNAIYEKLGVTSFPAYVAKYMAKQVVNIIAFLLTLIVVTIVLRAIIFSLNVIADLPVLGAVNRLLGGGLGMVVVLIIVWVLFLIITMMYTTSIGKELFQMIQDNEWLSMIYDLNPVVKLATTIRQIGG